MGVHSINDKIYPAVSLPVAARIATENGQSVDTQGFDAVEVEFISGAVVDGTHVFAVQDSADNSTFAAVASGTIIGALPTLAASGLGWLAQKCGLIASRRYVRVNTTVTGATNTGGATYGANIIRGYRRHAPAATP